MRPAAVAFLLLLTLPALAADKLSPFTEVVFEGDTPFVRFEGKWYELLELDGLKAERIVKFCKRTYDRKWDKRFAEDLVEVLEKMGQRPARSVRLVLRAKETGLKVKVARAAMTEENRKRVRDARRRARGPAPSAPSAPLTPQQVKEDCNQLRAFLIGHYSYLRRRPDVAKEVLAALEKPTAKDRNELMLFLARLLARFGDGHTRLPGLENYLPRKYTPFLLGVEGKRLVAFTPGRIAFVDDSKYLTAIDGVSVDRWLAATDVMVAHGSPQYRLWRGARAMRHVAFLRRKLDLPERESMRVELTSADGKGRTTLDFLLSPRKPIYGDWPRKASGLLVGDIGYLRIPEMRGDERWLDSLRDWMEKFRKTRGLILDVRGNGGGTRDALRVLMPYFMRKSDAPLVVNVAKYRLPADERPESSQGHLDNRFLYPATHRGWTKKERAAIRKFSTEFEPEWTPPERDFSRWHYMVVSPGAPAYYYARRVVVLMDAFCFSATDIFLGAFDGVRNVTLLGVPSGGGSGRSQRLRLRHSGFEVRVSSMASFQADGKLYDGNGVAPDVLVEPTATDWIGRTDTMLEAALKRLR
jgi:hypothetical protein